MRILPLGLTGAAIPSGVGFLGAASIWKGTQPKDGKDGEVHAPEVHGLTTATSVWFSAAIGLLCGGGLYVPAFFATALSVVCLLGASGLRLLVAPQLATPAYWHRPGSWLLAALSTGGEQRSSRAAEQWRAQWGGACGAAAPPGHSRRCGDVEAPGLPPLRAAPRPRDASGGGPRRVQGSRHRAQRAAAGRGPQPQL